MIMKHKNMVSKMKMMMMIPIPSSITYMWNFGSLLGLILILQIVTGIFLAFFYCASIEMAFLSVMNIVYDVEMGWMVRSLHANGASFFFLCIYIHISRGLYYGSYCMGLTWLVGVLILFVLMGVAFVGYVLPWGQMSFWGATVITNLISAIPFYGNELVLWVWGGFSISGPTLERFFAIHFIMPFFMMMLMFVHLFSLHQKGSSNPLGIMSNNDMINFKSFFLLKDLLGVMMYIYIIVTIISFFPDLLMDPDNFSYANPMITPPHIQPEWYFLFAYAILRSVPNKLGGVIALFFSIFVLIFFPLEKKFQLYKMSRFNLAKNMLYWNQILIFIFLTWIGAMPVEFPYVSMGQWFSLFYFVNFCIFFIV